MLLLRSLIYLSLLTLPSVTWSNTKHAPPSVAKGSPPIQFYSNEETGAHYTTWAVTQDHRGIMYFGNESGVLEYDGAHWRLILLSNANLARSIDYGKSGLIVGGIGEFGYLASNKSGKTVYRSLSNLLNESQRNFGNVWSVHSTSHGAYFVTNQSVYRWHHDHLETIEIPKRNWGYKIYDDVFLYHKDGGISRIHNGIIEALPKTEILTFENSGRITLLPYANDKLLIVTTTHGSFIYHLDKTTQANVDQLQLLEPFANQADWYLSQISMYYFSSHTNDGRYIFSSLDGKLIIINADGSLNNILDKYNGLHGHGILDVFVDHNNNLWAATFNGIFHIELNSPWSIYYADNINSPLMLPMIHNGELYVNSHKGVAYMNKLKPTAEGSRYEFINVDPIFQQSFTMLSDNENLYASSQARVFLVDKAKATPLVDVKLNALILSLAKSKRFENHIFIGTYSTGLSAMEVQSKNGNITAKLVELDIPELKTESIRTITEDTNGDLWVFTEVNGLYHLRFNSDSIHDYKIYQYKEEHGIPFHPNNNFSVIKAKNIITTPSGVYQAFYDDLQNTNVTKFKLEPALTKLTQIDLGKAGGLLQLGHDIVVINTDLSLYILRSDKDGGYTRDEATFKSIPSTRGVSSLINTDSDKNLWVPVVSRLYRLQPDTQKNYQVSYPAYIRKVVTEHHDTLFNGNHLKQPLAEQKYSTKLGLSQADWAKPEMNYAQNSISFEFSAAFFEHDSKLLYNYKLEGFDEQWSDWSSNTKKEYTNLHEGSYTFHVKARNIYGIESQADTYQFTILPPWYRTVWMYLLYFAAFTFLTTICARLYSRQLIQARNKLKATVKLRTAELDKSLQDLKTAQDRLAEASHRAGMADVARNVMHNVGNIVNSINTSNGLLNTAFQQSKDADRVAKIADAIESEQKTANGNIANNAKISKIAVYLNELSDIITNKATELNDETCNMKNKIKEIEDLLSEQRSFIQHDDFAVETNIKALIKSTIDKSIFSNQKEPINIELHPGIESIPPLMIHKYKLEKILLNLLNNAKEAVEQTNTQDKNITITAKLTDNNHLSISISDNGVGINTEALNNIYSNGYTTKKDARGFGLHQCLNAAAEMDGSLQAFSDGEGNGAKFELTLPVEINTVKVVNS